jgi:hypothetical protein
MKRGAALVDVRLAVDFEKEHAAGAVNAPLFQFTAGDAPWDRVKKVAMGALMMRATGVWAWVWEWMRVRVSVWVWVWMRMWMRIWVRT